MVTMMKTQQRVSMDMSTTVEALRCMCMAVLTAGKVLGHMSIVMLTTVRALERMRTDMSTGMKEQRRTCVTMSTTMKAQQHMRIIMKTRQRMVMRMDKVERMAPDTAMSTARRRRKR